MNMKADSDQKISQAVALTYDSNDLNAPKVVAKGNGLLAENILALARENAVPVYKNKTLTGLLMAVELDREIPPELYQAVAEVLAHIYRLDKELGGREQPKQR